MPATSNQRLLLLDSASLYFRAFYGVPDRRIDAVDEPPTNAVRGFLDMVATLVHAHRPTHLVACWDDDWRPALRVEALPDVQDAPAHRGRRRPRRSARRPHPAGARHRRRSRGGRDHPLGVHGLRGGRRHRQLRRALPGSDAGRRRHRRPGPLPARRRRRDVRVLYTARGGRPGARRRHPGGAGARYGVATGDAYADMAVLRGDTSDGLPGVGGIGDKTAAQLIAAVRRPGALRAGRRLRGPRDQGGPAAPVSRRRRNTSTSHRGSCGSSSTSPFPDGDPRLPTRSPTRTRSPTSPVGTRSPQPVRRLTAALGLG